MPKNSRAVVGKAMLASAAVMLLLATLYWFRVIPLPDALLPIVPVVLFIAGLIDGLVGLRYLNSEP